MNNFSSDKLPFLNVHLLITFNYMNNKTLEIVVC
jgi:hypothetical protein